MFDLAGTVNLSRRQVSNQNQENLHAFRITIATNEKHNSGTSTERRQAEDINTDERRRGRGRSGLSGWANRLSCIASRFARLTYDYTHDVPQDLDDREGGWVRGSAPVFKCQNDASKVSFLQLICAFFDAASQCFITQAGNCRCRGQHRSVCHMGGGTDDILY